MEGKTSIDQDNASWITRSSSVYKTVWSNQRSGTYANLICTTNRGRGQLCQGWPASFPESFQVHTSIDVSLSPSLSLSFSGRPSNVFLSPTLSSSLHPLASLNGLTVTRRWFEVSPRFFDRISIVSILLSRLPNELSFPTSFPPLPNDFHYIGGRGKGETVSTNGIVPPGVNESTIF